MAVGCMRIAEVHHQADLVRNVLIDNFMIGVEIAEEVVEEAAPAVPMLMGEVIMVEVMVKIKVQQVMSLLCPTLIINGMVRKTVTQITANLIHTAVDPIRIMMCLALMIRTMEIMKVRL